MCITVVLSKVHHYQHYDDIVYGRISGISARRDLILHNVVEF